LRAQRSNPARAKRAKKSAASATGLAHLVSAPAGAQLDCFAALAMTALCAAPPLANTSNGSNTRVVVMTVVLFVVTAVTLEPRRLV
jgi:hypothetical protein